MNTPFRLFLLAATVLLTPGALIGDAQGQENAVPLAKDKYHLFLLVGHSNMAGRGKVSEEDREPHPRVLMFTQGEKWVPAVDPMHLPGGINSHPKPRRD